MKMRVLLYRTPWKLKAKYIVNWLISARTLSKWSHIEVQDPDANGQFGVLWSDGHYEAFGTCYTSTMRGDDNGTVVRDASEVLDHPENWDFYEIELSDDQYAGILDWMDKAVRNNYGYATWDILKFISPIHFQDHKRNICSEFVNNALWIVAFFKSPGIISPGAVAKKLTKLGLKVQSLIK